MIAMFFLCMVAAIFATVVIAETRDPALHPRRLGSGLLGWLISGNWPAKVGGALLIIGCGALLRFALLHVEVAPPLKLMSGGLGSVVLLLAARFVQHRYGRREVSAALSGAAFGVAYLTAYSAYGFFHYLESFTGLALLATIAVGAGAYAMWRNTVSIALLAMFGAFLAPAFAIEAPTAVLVYGYYLVMSQLVLVAVAMRGWRPLIHLSFLFTLGGGAFFAWTAQFYQPQHFDTMLPLLLALAAVHTAMPLLEQRTERSAWTQRFDFAYFALLPMVTAASLSLIAPTHSNRANALMLLGAIWLLAAVAIRVMRLQGTIPHAVIGTLLVAIGAFLHRPEWPWFLIGLAISVSTLWLAQLKDWSKLVQGWAAGAAIWCAALFVGKTLMEDVTGAFLFNGVVLERLAVGALLIVGGLACRRLSSKLAGFFSWFGYIGLFDTIALELYRWNIAQWPLIIHSALIVMAFALTLALPRFDIAKPWTILLCIALAASTWWASDGTYLAVAYFMLVVTPLSLIALGFRDTTQQSDDNSDRITALVLTPIVAVLWGLEIASIQSIDSIYFVLAIGVTASIVVLSAALLELSRCADWLTPIVRLTGIIIGAILLFFTVVQIERGIWPVLLDLLCLLGLILVALIMRRDREQAPFFIAASAIGAALLVQATLLRLFGREHPMSIAMVFDLEWPAVISLFWSSIGAALTITARNIRSRALWTFGAIVLVACAVKLVLVDFGSLGQLANILAIIAAGLVFLLVSWLAPLPPKEEGEKATAT